MRFVLTPQMDSSRFFKYLLVYTNIITRPVRSSIDYLIQILIINISCSMIFLAQGNRNLLVIIFNICNPSILFYYKSRIIVEKEEKEIIKGSDTCNPSYFMYRILFYYRKKQDYRAKRKRKSKRHLQRSRREAEEVPSAALLANDKAWQSVSTASLSPCLPLVSSVISRRNNSHDTSNLHRDPPFRRIW